MYLGPKNYDLMLSWNGQHCRGPCGIMASNDSPGENEGHAKIQPRWLS